ncbi:MAG: tRNA (adenosine(37)-N6)-threonylcarbamoyltransferase complex ATPase subunit type 1 TsaE [Deltaproteobacteria bacterium HGW-Deltaproteobacteria-10]|nr:MAG: tRNA (adenosine(37)-N6)-threonylcarbamoyltransferase complex ATPase subunit type 1 TsaE [Deltaproteobacteria bacterium HGW-Deltaproteobacteria-10]
MINEKSISIITCSAQETFVLAQNIGEKLEEGDILALSGELGSGKTCFTGGLARGLGVSESYQITSPTFTLINEYPAKYKLYHFDVYRLNDSSDMEDLGYEEYFAGYGVVVIEWAEKISEIIPAKAFFINFEYIDDNKRKITIKGPQSRLKEFCVDIKNGG